ncbi:hypothetical protein ACPB8Q_02050 [Methanocaldococcus indicus]|uniref:hypothetical protein n=1 Tax=Methanocaldococcus indicus TaxID=213231 RepID=UPI003C6D64A8
MVSFDKDKMLNPSIIGGIVGGVLGVFCCLSLVIGGVVAAYQYIKNGGILDYENCGLVGAIAGVIGGVIGSILNYIFIVILNLGSLGIFHGAVLGGMFIFSLIFSIIFGAILGAIGGVLYAFIKSR